MLFTSFTARPRARRLLGVVTAGVLVLAACSNSSDSKSTTAPAVTTAPASTTASTGTDATATTTGGDNGSFQPISGVPGVSDTEISFAVLGTGPANPLGYCLLECYNAGVQAYFDYRNSIGGVNGRQLVIGKTVDDELGNNEVKSLELKDDNSIFGIFFAPLLYAGLADLRDTDIPVYTTYPAAPDANNAANIYMGVAEQCTTCSSPSSTYEAKLAGKTKVASIGFGVSQASKDCVDRTEKEVKQWSATSGVEFVYKNNDLPFGFPNGLGPEVTAMKAAGVDFVSTCIDQNSVLILEQELERQGMGDVVVALPQGYGDTEFLSNNAALLEGDILMTAYLPFEADGAGTQLDVMKEWLGKTGVVLNDYAIQGWLNADLAVSGIIAAGPDFDRAKVIAATNSLTAYTAGGLTPPVDWSTGHAAPADGTAVTICQSFVIVKGGKTEIATDAAKPWACFDLPMDSWTDPTLMAFS
jgi:hypothetical protein